MSARLLESSGDAHGRHERTLQWCGAKCGGSRGGVCGAVHRGLATLDGSAVFGCCMPKDSGRSDLYESEWWLVGHKHSCHPRARVSPRPLPFVPPPQHHPASAVMPGAGPNPPDLRPNNQMTAAYPSVPSRGEGADAVARSGGSNGGTGDGDGGEPPADLGCVTSGSYALGNGMLNLSWGLQSVRPRHHALIRQSQRACIKSFCFFQETWNHPSPGSAPRRTSSDTVRPCVAPSALQLPQKLKVRKLIDWWPLKIRLGAEYDFQAAP